MIKKKYYNIMYVIVLAETTVIANKLLLNLLKMAICQSLASVTIQQSLPSKRLRFICMCY